MTISIADLTIDERLRSVLQSMRDDIDIVVGHCNDVSFKLNNDDGPLDTDYPDVPPRNTTS